MTAHDCSVLCRLFCGLLYQPHVLTLLRMGWGKNCLPKTGSKCEHNYWNICNQQPLIQWCLFWGLSWIKSMEKWCLAHPFSIKFTVLPFQPHASAKHLEAHTLSPHLRIFPSSTTGISRNHLDVHSFDLNVQHPTVHVPWHNVRSNLNPWPHRDHPNHLPPWRNSSDFLGFKEFDSVLPPTKKDEKKI